MEIVGKKFICDRCGQEQFSAYRESIFPDSAEYPEAKGWKSLENYDGVFLNLCPGCAAGYEKTVLDYLGPEYARRHKRL